MKKQLKQIALVLVTSFAATHLFAQEAPLPVQKLPFSVYSDMGDHFIPSGWMGDYGDLKLADSEKTNPAQGTKCIKITYTGKATGGQKWAGIYWQDPANNWGTTKNAGYNLTGAKLVKFFARGEKGGEVVEFKSGGISSGDYPDSYKADAPATTLTQEWKEYEIDLAGQDLSHVIGGFVFALNKDKNPDGAVFFLDNIRFE